MDNLPQNGTRSDAAASHEHVVRRASRAPQTDRTALVVPPWSDAVALAVANQRWFDGRAGLDWQREREQARREVLAAAVAYTAELVGCVVCDADVRREAGPSESPGLDCRGPLIVGGHQPELFHPGVWAKNFAMARLAERCGGVALQLTVDHDLLEQPAIRVPVETASGPHFAWEPFDRPQLQRPWEEARVQDRELFATFATRVAQRLEPWGIAPLVTAAWPTARNCFAATDSLVDALTAARVCVERSWGLHNLELPVSRLSALPAFLRFVARLADRSAELVGHYNDVVHEYRRANRVRNRAHPVPDLAIENGWSELPLWVWNRGETRRHRPFARRIDGWCEVRDHERVFARWRIDSDEAAEILAAQARQGLRIRPRALSLTLFSRLFFADVFVHGLGGAKYDEMTDALATRMFATPPPSYLTVSATARLPLVRGELLANPTSADIGQIRHALWELRHNPQRWVDVTNPHAAALVQEKRALIAMPATDRGDRRKCYLRLREINAELAATQDERRAGLTGMLQARERLRDENRVRLSREFSWVLFPEHLLRPFYAEAFPAVG